LNEQILEPTEFAYTFSQARENRFQQGVKVKNQVLSCTLIFTPPLDIVPIVNAI